MENRLIDSMKEAVAYAKGDSQHGRSSKYKAADAVIIPDAIDLKSLRGQLHMTQEEFAARYGFNLYTLRNWEYGRRHPDKAVKAYLYAISKEPLLIEQTLRS